MKQLFLVMIAVAFFQSADAQKIKPISRYYFKTPGSAPLHYFRIGKGIYVADNHNRLYKDGALLLQYPSDSFVTYEVYAETLGAGARMKGRFDFISLTDPSRKWEFNFYYRQNTGSIKKSDDKKNILLAADTIVKQPVRNVFWKSETD